MARFRNNVSSDNSIAGGLIMDSRDVFSKERYEERMDYKLAVLTQQFYKNKVIDRKEARITVEEFIRDVEAILKELEDMKRRAEQEEARKIDQVRSLFVEGAKINTRSLKRELEKFGKHIKSNTLSGLRSYTRREKRVRRGKAPLGYVLKKLRHSRALDRDVAKRTVRASEDAPKEHELFSEVDYLTKALNARPNEKTLVQLSERIKLLANRYERNLEDFLDIELDIEIEEARKLHRIDHYITFLKMVGGFDELIEKLRNLKKKAEFWIYQDSIDAKKLVRYAKTLNYGLSVLESSEDKEFQGIKTINSPINMIAPGIIIYKQGQPPSNKGVVLIHGIGGRKEGLLTLGKRLASQNYIVYSIDMASHGGSKEKFRLGRSCEYVQEAVKWLRLNRVKNVGVVGHSAGAVTALFALCGYNQKVEDQFYNKVTELIKEFNGIAQKLKRIRDPTSYNKELYETILKNPKYLELKKIVLSALQNMISGRSRIDVAVMLAAPLTFQFVFPASWAKILKRMPNSVTRSIFINVTKLINALIKKNAGENSPLHKLEANKNQLQFNSLIASDTKDLFEYIATIKNPYDFINLIDFLCDNIKNPDRDTGFLRYYRRNFIRKTPKLFIYGLNDELLKPLKKNNMKELEEHYRNMGATEIVRYPNVMHVLNEEGKIIDYEGAKLPKMTYKIISFLDSYLGAGRLV